MKTWAMLIRRELWERRGLWLGAPIAALFLIALSLFGRVGWKVGRERMEDHALWEAPSVAYGAVWGGVSLIIVIVTMMMMIGYLLDALHAERKDRSILFWRSLPVTDRDTVLAKFAVGMLVLPLISAATIVITHAVITGAVSARYGSPDIGLWRYWWRAAWAVFTGTSQLVLWYAPVGSWLLLASAWARRAPFLYALVPPFALIVGESMLFGSRVVRDYFTARLDFPAGRLMHRETDGGLLTDPQLWLGVGIAAVLLTITIRVRRYRDEA
ncbi:MAG: ABC-2 transporter permease [Steroidobacteraceae bacterium]